MVTVTDKAKDKILELRKEEGRPEDSHIRVGVVGGGCSGLMYNLEFDSSKQPTDMEFQDKGIRIVVDKKSITKASEELHMTQPAVSIQISNLQSQFDIPLIEVIARKVYVTEFGMELYKLSTLTSVQETGLPIGFSLFPNPAFNILSVMMPAQEDGTLTVFDITGREMAREDAKQKSKITFDITAFENGLYMMRFSSSQGSFTKKFVKE